MISNSELTGVTEDFSEGELVYFTDVEKEVVFCRIIEGFEEPITRDKGFIFEIIHPYELKNLETGERTIIKKGSLPSYAFRKVNEA